MIYRVITTIDNKFKIQFKISDGFPWGNLFVKYESLEGAKAAIKDMRKQDELNKKFQPEVVYTEE